MENQNYYPLKILNHFSPYHLNHLNVLVSITWFLNKIPSLIAFYLLIIEFQIILYVSCKNNKYLSNLIYCEYLKLYNPIIARVHNFISGFDQFRWKIMRIEILFLTLNIIIYLFHLIFHYIFDELILFMDHLNLLILNSNF